MIPQFPNFKKIALSHRKLVESFTLKFKPYSTFDFTNVWAWDTRDDRAISELNGNLVVYSTDNSTLQPFYSFLGTNQCEETSMTLLDYARASNASPKLRFITQETAINLGLSGLQITEDRNNFDYIYRTSEIAYSSGNKFKSKRHNSKRFSLENPGAKFEVRSFDDPAQDHVLSVFHKWQINKELSNKPRETENEKKALIRLLSAPTNNRLIFSTLFLKNNMIGFSIDEVLPNGYAMSHFIKADSTFKGIYEYMNEHIAQHLLVRGIKFWNWQQDLDIAGLRAVKMSYHPLCFLKKYDVSLAHAHFRPKKVVAV